MSSRELILNRVRRNQPAPVELPPHFDRGIAFADPRAQFLAVLEQVGGRGSVAADLVDADSFVRTLPVVQEAKSIVSLVKGLCEVSKPPSPSPSPGYQGGGFQNIDINSCREPHELAGVDVAIAQGEFGVAENAAVWITDENVTHRAIYFICQHLVLIVPAREIVHNMHEAYERLGHAFDQQGFACFLSGPSKTADIEQSLVIGAQGPRSLTVVLVEGM